MPSSAESVNEGHPDKICDQFSDVVLDACLTCDTKCKVPSKTCVKDNMFMVTGEITVAGKLHHETVVQGVIHQLQHTDQVIDVPVVLAMQVPWVRVVAETAEIPLLLLVKKIGVIPETAEIPQLLLVKKIGVILETAEIPQSLSDVRGVVQNIGIDSFIDDLSSVGSQGSNRQDCEVLSHVGKQSRSIQQQQHQDSNQQQPTRQVTQEKRGERGKGRKGEEGMEEEGTEAEEASKKDVTGWTVVTRSKKHRKRTVQIFVKVDGGKTSAMVMKMSDKMDDIVKKIPVSDQDVYVTSGGRILRRSDKLESCEVRDGSTIQVMSRMRGQEQSGQEASRKRKDTGAEVHGRRRGRQRSGDSGEREGGNNLDVGRK